MDSRELAVRFTHHAPKGDQEERYQRLRQGGYVLATLITELTPESREQSLAMTALEETVMWANAAIARRDDGQTPVAVDEPDSPSGQVEGENTQWSKR